VRRSLALFRRWLCLCFGELCRDFDNARRQVVAENIHLGLIVCLRDPSVEVRAAAVYALNNIFGVSWNRDQHGSAVSESPTGPNGEGVGNGDRGDPADVNELEDVMREMERTVVAEFAALLVSAEGDASPLVRREVAMALSSLATIEVHRQNLREAIIAEERGSATMQALPTIADDIKEMIPSFDMSPWMQPYTQWLQALRCLTTDCVPAVREVAEWGMVLVTEDQQGTPRALEAIERLLKTRVHGSIFAWSKRQFAQVRGDAQMETDPLSFSGSMRLYWSRRNDLMREQASAMQDCLRSTGLEGPASASSSSSASSASSRTSQLAPTQLSSLSLSSAAALMAPTTWRRLGSKQRGQDEDKALTRSTSWHDAPGTKGKYVDFEQAVILENETEMTSLLLFHPYEDLLVAVDEGQGINVWNYVEGTLSTRFSNAGHLELGPKAPTRVTSVTWLNADGPSLLCAGAEDGVVRVWSGLCGSTPKPEIVTSFRAASDVNVNDRGSGLVTSFLPTDGWLYCGGSTPFVRCWDLQTEQCLCRWHSGSESCVTTLWNSTQGTSLATPQGGTPPNQLVLAGFADGGIRIFDPRLPPERNCLRSWNEHSNWVVGAYMFAEHGMVSAAMSGDVKFWDLRSSGAVKTIEAHGKHGASLTAFSVHSMIPVLATGSHAQFIKLMTLDGEDTASIKYHDGFLGQRIGPVSYLSFHPFRPILAAGATDSIVAIYTADS